MTNRLNLYISLRMYSYVTPWLVLIVLQQILVSQGSSGAAHSASRREKKSSKLTADDISRNVTDENVEVEFRLERELN